MQAWIAERSGRLDVFLTQQGVVESRVKAGALVRSGHVLVNDRIARKPALVLDEGDRVQASVAEPVTETRLEAHDLSLKVLYEDDTCMVIEKPAGVAVHPGAGIPRTAITILHGIAFLFQERGIPFSSASVLVHRLDKDTTGCLLVAKTPQSHVFLQKQFEQRTVVKTYLALVAGVPELPSAVIDASIGRSVSDRTKMSTVSSSVMRAARTTYRTLAVTETRDVSLLACDLHTGRTHQIRVHLKAIGHPILGDPSYATSSSDKQSARYAISSLCLHAWKLSFVSPADQKEHAVSASVSSAFLAALASVGIPQSVLDSTA